jgi:ethanolamine utilization protein EutN/carbon dioxide concentrating mechanism protein CcmL
VQLAEVIGTVVASQKDPKLVGTKFLVVRNLDAEMKALGTYAIAIDTVGAGKGDVVLHVAGSSARMTEATKDRPVDACIMAIVDVVELEGRNTYEKHGAAATSSGTA